MDTSSLNVELEPEYVRCEVKGKITQLSLPEEILCEKSVVQRSQTTGSLMITCPKANITKIEAQRMRMATKKEE